ncbi:hypothetical protein HDG35_003383 [Paraburkholderia sp. JPY681]|nr:hypothetical protein [Paraburkholderia atlantica]
MLYRPVEFFATAPALALALAVMFSVPDTTP